MRRLLLATLVVGVIAAANAGPAMADGLPKLSDVLSEPVGTVTETATTTVEDVTVVVDSTLRRWKGPSPRWSRAPGARSRRLRRTARPRPRRRRLHPRRRPAAENPVSTPSQAALPTPADGGDGAHGAERRRAQVGTPGRLAGRRAPACVRPVPPLEAFRRATRCRLPARKGLDRCCRDHAHRFFARADPSRDGERSAQPREREAASGPALAGGSAASGRASRSSFLRPCRWSWLSSGSSHSPHRDRAARACVPPCALAHPADVRFRLVRPG